jgi:hypothetical protein
MLANILWGSTLPAESWLAKMLYWWPITLLAGVSLMLLTTVVWFLGKWSTSKWEPTMEQQRMYTLRRLQRTYKDAYIQKMHGTAWIKVRFTREPRFIVSDVDRLLPKLQQSKYDLPAGVPIHQIYSDAPGGLLILGKTGSGKTIQMLALAWWLVEQAEQDVTQPLPFILPLSSWKEKRTSLVDWCCEHVEKIYNVPRQLCQQWIQEEKVVLLLDGLNELEVAAREACIEAINWYHHAHMAPLVVSSECTIYAKGAYKLNFQDAIMVQPIANGL